MKILIAPDKFKTTLSSQEVIAHLKEGILTTLPTAEILTQVVSDGGEGFLKAIQTPELTHRSVETLDPLGRKIDGSILFDRTRVFIESCQATGFHLLEPHQRNPFQTSSQGLATLLKEALSLEPQAIYIGLGSSATCDGGLGLAQGLGYQFLDSKGSTLSPYPENLSQIENMIAPIPPLTTKSKIYGIVDVLNPPLGKEGGVQVYSPQKGATPQQVQLLEEGMKHYVKQLEKTYQQSFANLRGGGAAGCLGLALVAYFKAKLLPGSQWLIETLSLAKTIQSVDVLITGEGHFDEQSLSGKIPFSLLQLAHSYQKKTILITGKKVKPNLIECQAKFSIEELIEQGAIADIHDSKKGLFLHGQTIGNKLANSLL